MKTAATVAVPPKSPPMARTATRRPNPPGMPMHVESGVVARVGHVS
jgi:hypothetical protein